MQDQLNSISRVFCSSLHGVITVIVVVVVLHQPDLVGLEVVLPVLSPRVEGESEAAEEDDDQEEGDHALLSGEDGDWNIRLFYYY